jgi:gas vesicle protein
MVANIVTGLIGLLGTLVGGLVTHLQQKEQGRSTHLLETERRIAERQENWREARRTAAVEFVNQVARLTDSTRDLWSALDGDVSEAELKRVKDTYQADWRTLASEFAAFQLAVTPELNAPSIDLYNAVKDYSVAIDELAAGHKARAKAERAQENLWEARRLFIAAAQEDLRVPAAGAPSATA